MTAYYNEFEPYAAQWLRNLISAGLIADGDVDERSIVDVTPSDLDGYTQCHFFAGIGVWSHALRNAGWSDEREVWTGSCPCQPFSAAGRGKGTADERHLWPEFMRLIRAKRPVAVLGEQVASKGGLAWLDIVSTDLEDAGYTFGAVDTCAAGFGAPHIRQRLYWLGNSRRVGRQQLSDGLRSDASGVGSPIGKSFIVGEAGCGVGGVADTELHGCDDHTLDRSVDASKEEGRLLESEGCRAAVNGWWGRTGVEWLLCRDDKLRPIEPELEPLVDGSAFSVGEVRAYGNAIVAPQAQGFVEAYMEVVDGGLR